MLIALRRAAAYTIIASSLVAATVELELNWRLCPTENGFNHHLETQGVRLSRDGPDDDCIKATVPGTVLANLISNGTFGFDDPYFEQNLASVPDINVTGAKAWTFFYVATFDIHAEYQDSHALLQLRSINYKAELWLDGLSVIPNYFPGTPDPKSVQGMFQRFFFPLGQPGSGRHYLAILVHPPPNPGNPNVGQGGTHDLAKDGPVSQFTAGWDWCQATPDRNTGLWDKATLKLTGSLQLRDPTVRVQNIDIEKKTADLLFSVSVDNRDRQLNNGDRSALVVLVFWLESPPGAKNVRNITRYLRIHTPIGATIISAEFPKETLQKAHLWYPHTHGTPSLYRATFRVLSTSCAAARPDRQLQDSDFNDEVSYRFGIRKIELSVNLTLGGLQAVINGQRTFLQGGNWIATDQLMRFAADGARATAEVRLHMAMGFNVIRVWGGGITERPEFFNACDEMGILVLSDLWMSGDNNGRWAGSYSWPLNHTLYLAAVADTFLLLRNHPSLLMYSGGNELYPTAKSPPPNILSGIRSALGKIDPDTFLIASTMTNRTGFDPALSLAPLDGPYHILSEDLFYERNPDLWVWQNHTRIRFDYPSAKLPFQPEIGSVSHPTYESLLRFMSPSVAAAFPGKGDSNVHSVWTYHKFIGFASQGKTTIDRMISSDLVVDHVYRYGAPSNISEYCVRAQLAQYTQYRSLFESYKRKMFEWYSAVIVWKSQGPWPALRGGLYDWYLAPTGGFYGARAALMGGMGSAIASNTASRRVHAQLDLKRHTLTIVAAPQAFEDTSDLVCVVARAFILNGCSSGELQFSRSFSIRTVANEATAIPDSELPWVGGEVLLYRIETLLSATASDLLCEALASSTPLLPRTGISSHGYKRSSVSDYWLSDWTASTQSDYSALGEWRENTASHLWLEGFVERCDCITGDSCQRAGCTSQELVLFVANSRGGNDGCGARSVAFAISAQLQYAGVSLIGDKRVLPSFYGDGLFSLLQGEERLLCIASGAGSQAQDRRLEVRLTGWNIKERIFAVPGMC